ncbi:hypothetical protein EPN15_03365 [Patescibacteria group bacterium]|nr:MAG: hypothetical protein EPN15_03365 [Patescibacteria group bacterium]
MNDIKNQTIEKPEEPEIATPEKKEKYRMRLSDKIIAAVLAVFFICIFYIVLDANKYRATVRIAPGEGIVGINPSTASLDFGDLSRGASAVRRVALKNGTNLSMYVAILKIGSISDLVDISKNNFKLKPRSEEKIEFTVFVPASAEIDKTYSGRVYLFKIPIF